MSEFYVERQCWKRWPEALLMVRKDGRGDERRRYVPERGFRPRTTANEFGFRDVRCGGCCSLLLVERDGSEQWPAYCPSCGARVGGAVG